MDWNEGGIIRALDRRSSWQMALWLETHPLFIPKPKPPFRFDEPTYAAIEQGFLWVVDTLWREHRPKKGEYPQRRRWVVPIMEPLKLTVAKLDFDPADWFNERRLEIDYEIDARRGTLTLQLTVPYSSGKDAKGRVAYRNVASGVHTVCDAAYWMLSEYDRRNFRDAIMFGLIREMERAVDKSLRP